MKLIQINNIYVNEDSITEICSIAELMDDTKIHYYVKLNNSSKIEINKTDYDALLEDYYTESEG